MILSFGSCVTIFNGSNTTLHIHADKQAEVIYNKQYPDVDYSVHYTPSGYTDSATPAGYGDVFIEAKRSKTDVLNVTVVKDGVEKKIAITPVHSWLYYANIYPLWGLGFFADYNNPNRFTYPHHIYVDLTSNWVKGYSTHKPFSAPRLEWVITPPLINGYVFGYNYLTPAYSPFGLSTGLNYHYSQNSFLSWEAGVAAINTGYHRYHRLADSVYYRVYSGLPHEHRDVFYLTFMNNHLLRRFDLGYGINIGEHSGMRAYSRYKMSDTFIYSDHYISLGGSFAVHYRLSNSFYAGFNYQPQLMAINNDNSKVIYEHLYSLGFSWRIGLLKN